MGEIGLALRQLLQVKIKNRSYLSFKPIDIVKADYNRIVKLVLFLKVPKISLMQKISIIQQKTKK